jgi:predicted TIM-barrel fold metal-dependent hydrolase
MSAVTYKYISADNHLNTHWLPASLWQDRLPERLRADGPRVVEIERGSYWIWEGQPRKASAAGSSWARFAKAEFGQAGLPERSLPPSTPELVKSHMDRAGVYGAVFYGDTRKWQVSDPELLLGMYRAYNDFCLELSAAASGRMIYLPNLPAAQPQACLDEFRRLARLGVKAVEFSVFDAGAPLASPAWEPLWEAAAGLGIVVCSHTGQPAGTPFPPYERGAALADFATSPFSAARPIAEMIFSGVFERHPGLKWVMAESRIGWLPFLFSWMDRQCEIRPLDPTVHLGLRPSEYVRRNICFTFENDWVGGKLLGEEWSLLADTVMWGLDYPHPQNVWPNPDAVVEEMLGALNAKTRQEILYGRASRLFGLDFPSA